VTYDHVTIYWLPSNGAIIQCGRKAHAIKAGRTSRVQQACDAIENEDGLWEYSTTKSVPHFVDLNAIACVVGRVYDRGRWTFIDRSGPTARVEMASPPSSSECSDVTDFSTSDEDPDEESVSGSSSTKGSPMDLDASSTGSSG